MRSVSMLACRLRAPERKREPKQVDVPGPLGVRSLLASIVGATHGRRTMKRAEVTEKILTAKRLKELTWDEIATKVGGASKILITAACMGQMKMTRQQATKAA